MGFIGSHLFVELQKAGHLVLGWDKKRGHDILDPKIEHAIAAVDVVYHLAAETSVNASFIDPDKMFLVNTIGTSLIVNYCVKHHKKLIFPSSAAVYFSSLSPYAHSKAIAEQIVLGVKNTIPVTVLRLFNVFGPRMNPDSGSIMYSFLTDKNIVIYGNGEQTRDFIHVRDVVSVMKSALHKSWDGMTVDVGMGNAVTVNYVAGVVAHARELPIIHQLPRREITWSIARTDLLKTLYHKKPTTDLQKDILALVKDYGAN